MTVMRSALFGLVALGALCANARVAPAQRTGILDPTRRVTRIFAPTDLSALRSIGSPSLLDSAQKDRFARLLLNLPDLGAGSSAWRISMRSGMGRDAGEASIHVNLSDILLPKSDTLSAFMLGLAGPLTNQESGVNELADLNGLAGTTRAELAYIFHLATTRFLIPSVSAHIDGAAPSFAFAETPTLVHDTVRHAAYRAGAGVLFKNTSALVRFGYDYENAYQASDDESLCSPLPGAPAGTLGCETIALGAPRHYSKHLGTIEVRYAWTRWFAARVQLNRDFTNNVNGYDLPIWFIPDVNSNLGGGIRFSYRTDLKRGTLSVFTSLFKI